MNFSVNRINMYPEPINKSNLPDRRNINNTNNNGITLVSLRNKQIKECVDTVCFSGLVNR